MSEAADRSDPALRDHYARKAHRSALDDPRFLRLLARENARDESMRVKCVQCGADVELTPFAIALGRWFSLVLFERGEATLRKEHIPFVCTYTDTGEANCYLGEKRRAAAIVQHGRQKAFGFQ